MGERRGRQHECGDGQPMPRRMVATHRGTKVRLVIDNWIFY